MFCLLRWRQSEEIQCIWILLTHINYSSETWGLYSKQERHPSAFKLRCLRRILISNWSYRVTNAVVLTRAQLTSLYAHLQRRLFCWFWRVYRMLDDRIPKVLYGELATIKRTRGRPHLRRLQKRHEANGHGHREVGGRRQKPLTLETLFTPSRRETKACRREYVC